MSIDCAQLDRGSMLVLVLSIASQNASNGVTPGLLNMDENAAFLGADHAALLAHVETSALGV
jgi:hypothetical protein